MAEREVRVKLATEADMSGVEDLENTLDNLKDKTVTVRPEVESTELEEVEAEIDKLQQKMADIYLGVDDTPFEEVEAELDKLEARRIELTVDVDDSALDSLEDKTVIIRPEIESMELDEVESRIDELQQKMADIYLGIDDTPLEEVEAELDELEARQIELTVDADSSGVDSVKSGVEDLEDEIENVNNSSIGPQADTSGIDQTKDSISGLEEGLTAVSAGVTLAGMENMVATAGNIQDSWNRLGLTFGEVTGQMKTDISEAGEATGRSGSLVRGYFNDMGIAGVRNTELLQQSFEALSGRAYQTGNSIESMEQKMKMMVMSGNAGARQLTALGISTEDLGRAMGVSADEATKMFKTLSQEERLRVLTQAMGDGKKANEDYKNSWQGLKAQIDKATGALMGAIGSAILPVLVPVMQVAANVITSVAQAFNQLPSPIRGVIGVVGALVMGFLALTTVISTIRAVANAIQFVQTAMSMWSAVTKVATAAQNALNASMLANPILLLVAALAVLIGYMVHLYQTNEQCRQSVNQLGADLQRVASGDYSGLKDVGNDLMAASDSFAQASGFAALIGEENYNRWVELRNGMLQAFTDMLGGAGEQLTLFGEQLGNALNQAGLSIQNFGIWFSETFLQVIMTIQDFRMQILMLPVYIASAIIQGIAQFQAFLTQVSGILTAIIGLVASWAGNLIGQFGSAASNAVSAFASNFTGIAAAVAGELGAMVSTAISYCQQLLDTLRNAAAEAVNLWKTITGEKSPGYIYEAFKGELDAMVNVASDFKVPSIMGDNAQSMVDNWGNPSLALDTGGNSGTSAVGGVTMNIVINGDVDSEERMERFAEYIINRMTWDNETANRTV